MGKKVKTGKFRKDKFYQLAKEAGYRSRAAFKLLQLNRTYHFLEKSRICVDLCAAPGGWCQVAATHMPMSSIIIGIDLAPIKPIANVITHVEDITTDKCRQLIKRDLNDNKADVFLHDGAPNVGKNWLHDAYQQNMLVLQSFKLATEFLKKGGWFITKVFRSKDYYSIMWVFQQFFKKVESTKPQASRTESAEIFVVCQFYKAPEKIDPKFFDIKFVFSEVESSADTKQAVDLFKPPKRNRGGYPEGDMTLYHVLKASEFIQSENFIELLGKSNCIEVDDEKIDKHTATTNEIKELIKDLKILGKTDLKNLLKWRLKVKSDIEEKPADINEVMKKNNGQEKDGGENEDELIENQIKEAIYNEKKLDKKKKKREEKEKKKLKEKLSLNMVYKDDILDHKSQGDNDIFSLNKIKTKKQLLELQRDVPGLVFSDNEEENDELKVTTNKKNNNKVAFSKFDERREDEDDDDNEDDEDDDEMEFNESDDDDDGKQNGLDEESDDEENPLLNDLDDRSKNGAGNKANLWFNKDSFDFLNDPNEQNQELLGVLDDDDDDEDAKKKVNGKEEDKENESDDDDDDDEKEKKPEKYVDFNGVDDSNKKRKLNPLELALGETIVNSKKARRDLIDATYNRYSTFEDESNLPQWFVEDEEKNYRRDVTVPRQVLNDYRKKFEDINARPIKKVVEAQARKKRRMSKKLDRARKKAETISDNTDMSEKERSREIKQVYKKAGLIGKKKAEVKYVVAKKGVRGRVAAKGIKGPYKVVDRRLKKDRKSMQRAAAKSKGKGGKGGKGRAPMQRGRKIQGGRPKAKTK